MHAPASSLLFSIVTLSGVLAVSGKDYERECIATVRATAWNPVQQPGVLKSSIEFEVVGKATAGTPYFARRRAEKGMTQCLKNYFRTSSYDRLNQCAAHDECADHVTPYNKPIEETIIEKLYVEKLGCTQARPGYCDYLGGVDFEYLSSRSPVGGHGCGLPSGFEFKIHMAETMCSDQPLLNGSDQPGCSPKLFSWC